MSFPQDGRDMDQRPGAGGSVRRARERVQAGFQQTDSSQARQLPETMADKPQMAKPSVPRRPVAGPTAGQPRTQRLQAPPGLQMKDGQRGATISRPTQVPQWPLPGPLTSPPSATDAEPYKPPPGKSQPPQRPPRPSRVPSMLDASKVQDPTPSFQYRPQSEGESSEQDRLSVPETPTSQSRPSTLSSVGSIPDFPLPVPLAPPRRSVNLGPPPSARRGASSFYSNLSYVSPIPEESPRSRSHTSFASSAAMPESWGTPSPGPSPNYPDPSYEDIIAEEGGGSAYDDDTDESRLVRSASLGKKGKATLVTTTPRALENGGEPGQRPAPTPIQGDPFKDGTAYVDASSSSSGALPTVRAPAASVTADSILNAYGAASAADPSNRSEPTPSPQPRGGRPYNRLSAIWKTPRPESEATTRAESRASLTSLPDLIRRATRLAASLERGRRPASRFDDLNDSSGPDLFGRYGDKEMSVDGEKHQSGLSDMLAAFPPPAQPRRSFRESLRLNIPSWPLPLNANRGQDNGSSQEQMSNSQQKGRRVCGLPFWKFIILAFVVLVLVAAAIVIPLELLVLRKRNGPSEPALTQCEAQLTCQNGGTNVVKQNVCSCICTGGFTGSSCTVPGATGCTTTTIAGDTNIDNVTLGDAIPRLIQQAQSNFSVALSPTTILAKLNAGNLSCSAENALVTFDGQSTPQGDSAGTTDSSDSFNAFNAVDGVEVETVTVTVGAEPTVVVRQVVRRVVAQPSFNVLPLASPAAEPPSKVKRAPAEGFATIVPAPAKFSTIFATTISIPERTFTSTTTTTTTIGAAPTAAPGVGFTPADDTVDFARVAVLFILQETTLDAAETAQITIQQLFADAGGRATGGVAIDTAKNVTLGNGNSIDLVNLVVHTANGAKGGKGASTSARRRSARDLPCARLGAGL